MAQAWGPLAQTVAATAYYLSLADEIPAAAGALAGHDEGRCAEGEPLRNEEAFPPLPVSADSLESFIAMWRHTLAERDCDVATPGRLVQALYLAVAGVRVLRTGGVRIKPSWDLPEGTVLLLDNVVLQGDFMVRVRLTRDTVRIHRVDSLSARLFLGLGDTGTPRVLHAHGEIELSAHVVYLADVEEQCVRGDKGRTLCPSPPPPFFFFFFK